MSKIGITIEEADESAYWMELIVEAELIPERRTGDLLREANELTAIFITSHKTASRNLRQSNRKSTLEN